MIYYCFSVSGDDNARVLIGSDDSCVALDANTLDVRWSNSSEVDCYNVAVLSRQGIAVADVASALTLYRLSDGASLGVYSDFTCRRCLPLTLILVSSLQLVMVTLHIDVFAWSVGAL